jgi:beta-galactosidase
MKLAKLLIAMFAAIACFAGPALAQQSPRQITSLSDGWKFRFGDAPDAVKTAGFDDSGWEQVSVPHTWNRIGEYSLARSGATNNKQGIGMYRLTYAAPPSAKGRRQYLDFAAVAIIADVWVNGVHVGQHKGAPRGRRARRM